MTRLCTLSPSVPASGESLTRKVIDSVGGSIGCACSGSVTSGAQSVSATLKVRQPGDGDDVAGLGLVDRHALDAAEGEDLGDAARLDDRALAVEHLDRLIGAHAEPEKMRPVMRRPR